MASAEMKSFLESRLLDLDASIDLSAGSPAQTKFIDPVLQYLGTDPFETDIDLFITTRLRQEFPKLFSGDPGAVRDSFVKPLILVLEPFKRETQSVKRGQSLADPSMLSDSDADALVANVFDERPQGSRTSGVVRVFYANPTNVRTELTVRFFTPGGLNFYPTNPTSMAAEEMVFNRQGSLFYMDVIVSAESEGSQYGTDANTVTGVSGLFGVVKVTNPRAFVAGSARLDTPSFVAQGREALSERSLVSRRGARARTSDVFKSEIKSVQVIGANDEEMMRDILVAEAPGHAWMLGQVMLFGRVAYVRVRVIDTYDGTSYSPPVKGDRIFVYLDQFSNGGAWRSLPQNRRFVRLTVEDVIVSDMTGQAPYQASFLVRWSDDPSTVGSSLPLGTKLPLTVEGGFLKKGTIRISSIPDRGAVSLVVNDQAVHVFGHTDIYARPSVRSVSKAVISSLTDADPFLSRTSLSTMAGSNALSDGSFDFTMAGVLVGDLLTIESGDDAGTYRIGKVTGHQIYLVSPMTKTSNGLRYVITRSISIDPFEPKIKKLPFGDALTGLQTNIGSNLFYFVANVLDYGAKVGDTVRIEAGLDTGDFTIIGFHPTLGGTGVFVGRPAAASNGALAYEIFTPQDPVARPLVRIRDIQLLDSATKATGISVPPAGPVAVVPTNAFTTAQVRGSSQVASGYILPAFTKTAGPTAVISDVAAWAGDRRYSQGFDSFIGGVFKAFLANDGTQSELLFPPEVFDRCSCILAVPETTDARENFPPIDPNPGDAITIRNGPNKGSYLVKSIRKWKYNSTVGSVVVTSWVYCVQIHGTFPVDVFGEIANFCKAAGVALPDDLYQAVALGPSFFSNVVANIGSYLDLAIRRFGGSSPGAAALQASAALLFKVGYDCGAPATGTLRSYFLRPQLFQQHTGETDTPTLYKYTANNGSTSFFRPSLYRYVRNQVSPGRLDGDAAYGDRPRDDRTVGSSIFFDDDSKPTMFEQGVSVGDIISINEELPLYGSYAVPAISTVSGTSLVQVPTGPADLFAPTVVGNLVYVGQGDDRGMYLVVGRPDGRSLILDRPLRSSTPTPLGSGSCKASSSAGQDVIVKLDGYAFDVSSVGKFITLFGTDHDPRTDTTYEGSYRIHSVIDSNTAVVERTSPFPQSPVSGWFVVTDAPATTPSAVGSVGGTELFGLLPIRVYNELASEYAITDVSTVPRESKITVTGSPKAGYGQPYVIYRSDVRRVTPTEMAQNKDGFLYYFDTEVTSLAPGVEANIPQNSYLTAEDGTYESAGYRFEVDDTTLSYSMRESGRLVLPTKILPIGVPDTEDGHVSLVGAPISIDYESAEVVARLQEFLDNPEDRVSSANLLARHFLPSYVSYDATYYGGSAPSVVAQDILDYINNMPIETAVDVSQLQKLIEQRGGNPVTPTKVSVTTHDWGRKVWVEFSENELGGTTLVPYDGTPRVTALLSGDDVSGASPVPDGERVNLVRG